MDRVENVSRKKRHWTDVQGLLLLSFGLADVMAFADIIPHALKGSHAPIVNARARYRAKNALFRLEEKGYVRRIGRGEQTRVRLTPMGKQKLTLMQEQLRLKDARPRRWDERYRLIIFDISERRKSIRDKLRRYMQDAGFLRIQDSVWLYPYDCEEYVSLLKSDLKIGKDVVYAVVEQLSRSQWIREHFDLSSRY